MTVFNLFEAAKLSVNPLTRGVLTAIATSDEMISQLMMQPTGGSAVSYNREKTLPTAEFVAPDHSSITESSATFDQVTVPLRLMVSDVDVYDFVEEQQEDTNSQGAIQLEKKLKAAGRLIAQKAITGGFTTSFTSSEATTSPGLAIDACVPGAWQDTDRQGPAGIRYTHVGTLWAYRAPGDRAYGPNVAAVADGTFKLLSDNPNKFVNVTLDVSDATADGEVTIRFASTTNEPDGLNKMIPTSQQIASSGADGDELSFRTMDRMIDELVKVRNKRVFMMNSKLKGKFFSLARGLGGSGVEMLTLPGVVGQVPGYRGIPILQNDWIVSTEAKGALSTLSSLYLVDLSSEGFYAYCGQGKGALNVDADPRAARVMGFKIREIGELESKEAQRRRVSWYGAFALGSELAAARAIELKTA